MCSKIQEITLTDEALSTVISEIDDICTEKVAHGSPLMCRPSLCVPCTDAQVNENGKNLFCHCILIRIALFDQVVIGPTTQTLTTVTIDNPDKEKDKNDLGHIMISYNHSTQAMCLKIAQALKVIHSGISFDDGL